MKKYIEIDGVKYVIDPEDESKALLNDKGEKTVFIEETPPADPPQDPPVEPPIKGSLEERAKDDPELARLLKEKADADEKVRLANEKSEEDRKEQLRKNGEFQQLATEADEKRKEAEGKATEASYVLDKYKKTVEELRDAMVEQIQEDKRSLIPDGNARKQIDYIQKNAKFLGVSVVNKGGNVPNNEDKPPLDEEAKLNKEFTELLAKEELTQTEKDRISELSRLIKEIKARKV